LYLHQGTQDGSPKFKDVTAAVGLVPLPLKAPHVEIQDFDNDGRADIYTSIVKFAGSKPHPVIFRNEGPRDVTETAGVRVSAMSTSAAFVDYDHDGRLDLFLGSWWAESPSLLLRNETPSGHWLDVQVVGENGVNRMGVGSLVEIYEAGKAGAAESRIGCREIATGYGYASSQEAIAHFGLGERTACDVVVTFPHGQGTVLRKSVDANQRIVVQ